MSTRARARAIRSAACTTPWGGAATGLPGAAPVPLASVVGFVTSRFSPLVHAVATACLGTPYSAGDLSGPRTGMVLATMFGDTVTLDTATRRLAGGQVHSPMLFFQSVTTSILGHLGRTYGISGPVECLSAARDGAAEALFAADLMLDQDDVDQVLLIGVELAANERATWIHRRLAAEGLDALPDGDCAVALLLARDGNGPATLRTAAGIHAAAPEPRYARFGWLAPLVAAGETVRPGADPAASIQVPGPYPYIVEPGSPS
ncbi:beta-ketoacyl synthase chain length factor [Winogradskya humida]|uniref:Beta-ketoacyl synthase-like N-terminal domain-containing protein n=1 Tax=Winogradskya humida TaxID=113566 RepID=A0ABQ3ZWV3_9ACTN|nr:beta-ketoacyl synthase chain length factor [Actinoplanes humidus]GIE23051.1 hypothetical protein Ahu01nite_061530 [Actinoplanes humidus]